MWPMLSKWDSFWAHGQNWVLNWYIIQVCILPFLMVVKILILDNPKQRCNHLTFGVLKGMKFRKLYHRINYQLGQKSSKLHSLGFKCQSKTFIVHLKYINNYDSKNLKIKTNHLHRYFLFRILHRCISFRYNCSNWVILELTQTCSHRHWCRKISEEILPKQTRQTKGVLKINAGLV